MNLIYEQMSRRVEARGRRDLGLVLTASNGARRGLVPALAEEDSAKMEGGKEADRGMSTAWNSFLGG